MAQEASHIIVTDELLSRYFAGEALPEEAMAIDDWKSLNAENAHEFDACWNAWNTTAVNPHQLPELSASWQQVQRGVTQKSPAKISLMRWVAIAAILTGLIFSATLLIRKDQAAQGEIVAKATDSITVETLPDGSVITMAAGSSVTYSESFGDSLRAVRLQGSAGFDVRAMAGKPFIVRTDMLKITVLGTAFEVTDTDSTVIVHVKSGKVRAADERDSVTMAAGQSATYVKRTAHFAQQTFSFKFDNVDLATVVARLSKAADKKIILEHKGLADLKISSNFENDSLDYILEVITTTLDLKYSYSADNEIHIED